ncbi:MAG TPA: hypothetical protein VGI22_20695 [Xanthobacteraceae bacterium]|jgi:hypothetical protein
MWHRRTVEMLALAAALGMTAAGAAGAQEKKFPDWKGQWAAAFPRLPGQQLRFDPNKPFAKGQEAPLTEEYQEIYRDNLAEVAKGNQGLFLYHASCFPAGMPTMMSAGTFEYIITPETTYILSDNDMRRIFTDGRPWPSEGQPTYQGVSMGKWIDDRGDGAYDVLEVETRGPFKGPRTYDASGLPLHFDNESTFRERIHLDKSDPKIMHDEITVFDHALTRPWTADKTYRRSTQKYPIWDRITCLEGTSYVTIGKEYYMVTADGFLMPTTKGQTPPDPKYFQKAPK